MINIPKGTKDVLPFESYKWQYVETSAREICRLYNVREIRTPTFEHTELFLRSIGSETDVVGKEMYTFLDKGERSITLKPEGTASVARAFIENSLYSHPLPLKMFYITPVFRYERPQAGRLREHHQFGVEFYGGDGAEYDAEVISLGYEFLQKMGVKGVSLRLNSIGCNECRKQYNVALRQFLSSKRNELCQTCNERAEKNPLRTFDCKVLECKQIMLSAPRVIDYICDDCKAHHQKLTDLLTKKGIPYSVDTSIVRGLDYYTKTVFEFVTDVLGAQGTVCGGGRYDRLVESVGGKPMPCVGFGLGLERLIMLIEASGIQINDDLKPLVFIASITNEQKEYCSNIADEVRKGGISTEIDFTNRSLKAQFKFADKLGAKYVCIVGDDEIKEQKVKIKTLSTGEETIVKKEQLIRCLFDMEAKTNGI